MSGEMELSLLLDSPTPAFQVVLQHLSSQDHASLRQASRAVFLLTTGHLPFITLRLSNRSIEDYLHQWCHATRQMQHVDSLHVSINGTVAADLLDVAMKLLAQQFSHITELQVLGFYDVNSHSSKGSGTGSNKNASVATLQPIVHLLPKLKSLVIEGIEVQNMVDDLKQLAVSSTAVEGWQLQSLCLNAGWGFRRWSADASVLECLTSAFPALQQLSLQHPDMYFGTDPQQQQLNQVATLAQIANAVLRMKSLRLLTIAGIPDIWSKPIPVAASWWPVANSVRTPFLTPSAAATTTHVSGRWRAEPDTLNASMIQGLLPSVTAAAAAFGTLDAFGCWLLEHHIALESLQVSTLRTGWGVGWQQKQQQTPQPENHRISSAPELVNIDFTSKSNLTTSERREAELRLRYAAHDSHNQYSNSSTNHALMLRFAQHLSQHSFRSAAEALQHIGSCTLDLNERDIDGLIDVLGHLKSLNHLEVILPRRELAAGTNSQWQAQNEQATAALEYVVTAAATASRLQSLVLNYGRLKQLPDGLLLPLTAAAGGPGSRLKKLKLVGDFITGSNVRARAIADSSYMQGLKQLDGLRELCILNTKSKLNREPSRLAVESLPADLEMLIATAITISSAAAADRSDTAMCKLQLRTLYVDGCQIDSHSLLSSDQLRELTIMNSTWLGGWPAASWPNLSKLTWKYDENLIRGYLDSGVTNDTNSIFVFSSSCDHAIPTFKYFIQQLCQVFRHLRSLTVQNVPRLSVDILQPLVQQQQQLRYIEFQCRRVVEPLTVRPLSAPGKALQEWLQQQMPWTTVHVDVASPWY